ncbi:MAG: T9SS type A sorting domain-containing protein [Ferruginibacter sp.]
MKISNLIIFLFANLLAISGSYGQANAYIQVLTLNSGNVDLNGVGDIQVTVGNTGPASNIVANNLRTQVSVPSAIVSILPNALQTGIPAGWVITSNNGTTIQLCNGSDVIAPGTQRNILIKIQGNAVGGPSTVSGVLSFRSGTNCTAPGSLAGNNTADDNSTSSVTVINIIPITLADFSAKLIICEPSLKWVTETEINSDRFEIERGNINNTNWSSIGVVAARGYSNSKTEYKFTDRNNSTTEKILYRLKMIDKDGHYKYSKILPVFINCKTANVYVYPNPVQDGKLYVSLTGSAGLVEASLLSMSGQVLLKAKMNNGTNSLNVSNIANGTYILNIQDANGVNKKEKVIIQH